ncbi:MAG TPA: sigma 54-interacting transcriptional regulator [Bacillales bacterium]|nr:sigma 54-interacting transcriptional regulator [Bacillales bacterium]
MRRRDEGDYFINALMGTDNDLVTIIDVDKRVLFWNKTAEKTYNITSKQIVGKKITRYFDEAHLMILKVLRSKQPVRGIYHRPTNHKHVIVNSSPVFDDDGVLLGAVSVEQDITHTVKLSEKLSVASSELHELKSEVYRKRLDTPFSKLTGNSLPIQRTISLAMKAAKTSASVLILGESGTGKELCARAIHETSPRKDNPFVPINCGAIPAALFESELFGYERGAFTGAVHEGKQGKIEAADGGTLFLDEIGELPLDMQVKLLRVLQENIVYRIGASKGKQVDVRVVAATNRDLRKMVETKTFRTDLFYRLNVIELTMPALRDRLEDIGDLVSRFLFELEKQYRLPSARFTDEAVRMLMSYHWPGNIRELRNIVERALILSEKNIIGPIELQSVFPLDASPSSESVPLPEKTGRLEKEQISRMLVETGGNKSEAARRLGISRVGLYKKLKKYEIES